MAGIPLSGSDFIADAVARARDLSPHPPKLNRPARKLVLDDAPQAKVRTLGRETGPDGRAKRRSLGVPSLGDVLRKTIKEQGWEEQLGHGWVFGHWEDLVGETVAAHSAPDRVDNKILHITCDNSAWATNLRYLQSQILATIAEKIGDDIIVELRIHGPKQHRNYEGPMWVKPQGSNDTYG